MIKLRTLQKRKPSFYERDENSTWDLADAAGIDTRGDWEHTME
jgi:hypothetical protein